MTDLKVDFWKISSISVANSGSAKVTDGVQPRMKNFYHMLGFGLILLVHLGK